MSDERIVSILNHIERSYGDCTLESIASDTGYSTSYLSSLIKQKTGKNVFANQAQPAAHRGGISSQ